MAIRSRQTIFWAQLAKAWHITAKDMRTYYLKPPLISWGMLFPAVMILAFYLRAPADIQEAAGGLAALTVLFGATSVEAVVISFEKRIGALERLLMAPITPYTLLVGKTLSGTLFGTLAGGAVWFFSSLAWGLPLVPWWPLAVILLSSLAFSMLGVIISLLMREVFDAMTVSNLLRFPMIFLCGVFMPLERLPLALRFIAKFLPLTYTVDALRGLSHTGGIYPITLDLAVLVAFSGLLYGIAWLLMRQRLEDLL